MLLKNTFLLIQKCSFFILFLLGAFVNQQAHAQEQGFYLYVEVLPEFSPLPASSESSNNQSTNETLNTYFEQFEVTQFIQSFPNAKNPELASFYEIHANGDIQQLQSIIKEESFFGQLYLTDYPVLASSCPNPVGINDTWIALNWANNDALDLIEAQCAWTITTGNNVEVAVIDTEIDATHEDLTNQIVRTYGTYNGPSSWTNHGTVTAGMVAAETNNNKGIASIGYNTDIAFYRTGGGDLWQKIWKAYQDGSRIINVSWSGIGSYPNVLAVEEMVKYGTVLTLGAGNTPGANFHSAYAGIDGAINVSGVDGNNNHGPTGHARNSHIDLCAPSTNVSSTYQNNTYGGGWGTSFAAPQVAGTAALMRSVNPCLAASEIEDMMKETCDPISDGSSYPGLLGAGRLNAYRAVEKAQAANSTTLDLYIKDRKEDFGISGGYHWQAARDNSPDIWVRNQNDGMTNHTHQDPEFQVATPVYVYVKVRNKSCNTSLQNEVLRLYWTKAASWSSWPQNWNGSSPTIGNVIGSINIPQLLPGRDTILEFTWNILNPNVHQNWSTCLLARIENSTIDPITVYPGRIDDDVYFNNNIAMKNITILDQVRGIISNYYNDFLHAPGRLIYIGESEEVPERYDIRFSQDPDNAPNTSLNDEAEIIVYTDAGGWELLLPYVEEAEGIDPLNPDQYSFRISDAEVWLRDVDFGPSNRIPIHVGFSFLTEEVEHQLYAYQVQQFFAGSDQPLGGQYFYLDRGERSLFYANAGANQTIYAGSAADLSAESIGEAATYNWYDGSGNLIHEGAELSVEPGSTTTYRLEVIADHDSYKDYDELTINVIQSWINSLDPNPASGEVNVSYRVKEGAETGMIMLVNTAGNIQRFYEIDPAGTETTLGLSDLPPGSYTANLIVDDVITDSKTLIVQ